LSIPELRSYSTDDNVEHLYFTDAMHNPLPSGYYALVIANDGGFATNYGISYTLGFTAVPEPGTLTLVVAAVLALMVSFYRRRRLR
jgi:hypothetical protein